MGSHRPPPKWTRAELVLVIAAAVRQHMSSVAPDKAAAIADTALRNLKAHGIRIFRRRPPPPR